MERNLRRDGSDERRDGVDVLVAVVPPRHDERRHLDMAPGGVKSLDRTADRGEIAADPVVVFLRRTLQVDVRRVDERRQLLDDRRLGAAVGDEDVEHPPGVHLARAVAHELPSDQRLVVGVGKAEVAAPALGPERQFRQLAGRRDLELDTVLAMLRNGVVLAERAPQVAPEAPDRKHVLPGMEERYRLLLDRVKRNRRDLAVVRRDDAAALGPARAAEPHRTVGKPAAARTGAADSRHHCGRPPDMSTA